jgi:type III pantothenate kinase
VDAVSAYEQYGGPVIVVDFGTATTYDLVTEDGTFRGGVISPGIRISANALWNNTASLPEIEIKCPGNIIARETISAMQAGLFYGTIGQSEYIIRKIKEEAKLSEVRVIATGGLGKIVSDNTDEIEIYDADLTLKGLLYIYQKQKR